VLDGAQNNDHYTNAPNPIPNPDTLQEFAVPTNAFSAEFGRQSAGIVNAVTQSRTNGLHGSAFELVRNKALNAANFFAPVVNGSRLYDGLKRNQFGATAGGPVLVPKLYNGRNKTFFFFSYQQQILRQAPAAGFIIVPPAALRAGDFSSLLPKKPLKDPFNNGEAYPQNQIPQSEMNPAVLYILNNFIPLPNSPEIRSMRGRRTTSAIGNFSPASTMRSHNRTV
jgi:hypothetical protein